MIALEVTMIDNARERVSSDIITFECDIICAAVR